MRGCFYTTTAGDSRAGRFVTLSRKPDNTVLGAQLPCISNQMTHARYLHLFCEQDLSRLHGHAFAEQKITMPSNRRQERLTPISCNEPLPAAVLVNCIGFMPTQLEITSTNLRLAGASPCLKTKDI